MSSLVQPIRVLVDPVDAMPTAVEHRRWFWPLAIAICCALFSGLALHARVDTASQVVSQLEMSGELKGMTETDLADKIKLAENMALVVSVAKAVFLTPLLVLLLAFALKFFGWLFARPAKFMQTFSTASIAFLPIAVFHLILGVCALAQHSLKPARVASLVPSSLGALVTSVGPKAHHFLGGLDFFNLWSVGLLALGFAAASGMRRHRALLLLGVAYLLFLGVTMSLSGMGGGPGGGGPH